MMRVAVTGIGIVAPGGNDARQFFDHLIGGHSSIRLLRGQGDASQRIAATASFDPRAHFPAPRLRMLDRVSQIALVAARQAIESSAMAFSEEDRQATGVFMGTGMGGAASTDEGYATLYRQNPGRIKPYAVLMAMNNAAASWIGIEHGLSGPNLTWSTACSSSAVAIGEAWLRVRSGAQPMMLAGGAEAPLTPGTIAAWEAMKTLASADQADPSASCKPFSKNRSGFVLGEGAGVLLLEEWQHATRRGAPVYGELIGYGLNTDSTHITRPTVEGQARAMRLALDSAAAAPDHIGYINAHGTGTLANDPVETAAIRQVFGPCAGNIPVSSSKSMHGHLLGAAGVVEFIATLLAVRNEIVPPTMHLRIPDPECDLDYVPNAARKVQNLSLAMSNSFAFGGTNAVLICRKI